MPKTRANAESEAAPPSRVRCKLATMDDVKTELARLYREGKAGARPVADVSRLANVLAILGRLIEGADLEDRVTAMEADLTAMSDRQLEDIAAGRQH